MNSVERVKKICKERKIPISRLEKDLGFANGYVNQLKKGSFPDDRLLAISEYLNLSVVYLQTGNEPQEKSGKVGVKVPILGKVAAGIPIEEIEDVIGWEEISESMARKGKYFCLEIKGDSMEPDLRDGDIVVVRHQNTAENGDIVIAQVNGNEATCKRIAISETGITLMSYNPKYEPMPFTNEQIESIPVSIIGKVVESRRKF